jgi:hypothetical protein
MINHQGLNVIRCNRSIGRKERQTSTLIHTVENCRVIQRETGAIDAHIGSPSRKNLSHDLNCDWGSGWNNSEALVRTRLNQSDRSGCWTCCCSESCMSCKCQNTRPRGNGIQD